MENRRFEDIYTEGKLKVTKVVRDNETGVLYMMRQEGYGVGMTILVDREGKPLVDKDFKP